MRAEAIRHALAEIVQKELDRSGPLPNGELSCVFDSIERMTLVVAIEDHFRICLDDEDEKSIQTIDDLISMIGRKLDA